MQSRKHFPRILNGSSALALVTVWSVVASPAYAGAPAPAPPGGPTSIVTKGPGRVLALVQTKAGLFARSCAATEKCSGEGGTELRPPESALALRSLVAISPIRTSAGRELIEVRIDGGSRSWILLVAPSEDEAPRVVWNGWSSESSGSKYTVEKEGVGQSVRLTTTVQVCDRSIVSEHKLDPKTLEFALTKPSSDLLDMVKEASELKSAPADSGATFPLLSLVGSSSGRGALAIDQDSASAWKTELPVGSEGEFVSFTAPRSVVTSGVRLSFGGVAGARSPTNVWFITDGHAYRAKLPDSISTASMAGGPGALPATSLDFKLPAPVHSRCLAVVLGKDEASAKSAKQPSAVALTEVALTTAFDGKSPDQLAQALGTDGGVERADILSALGEVGTDSAAKAYGALDPAGRDLARRVVDAGGCTAKLKFYVPLLLARETDEVDRAREHVERCGKEAVAPLSAALESAQGEERLTFAEELALLSPDAAVPILVRGLAANEAEGERLLFRKALVKASSRESSARAFDRALADDRFGPLTLISKIDLLRGMGSRLGDVAHGKEAFAALWKQSGTDFRSRYLLLAPAAVLGASGDKFASDVLSQTIAKGDDDRLRARAAELSADIPTLSDVLTSAAIDSAPRVREASFRALSGQHLKVATEKALVADFAKEPWTFVKRSELSALAAGEASVEVNIALSAAMLNEEQPVVREDILRAFGARRAGDQRVAIVQRATDAGEATSVRIAAAFALGDICDESSVKDLFSIAARGLTPANEGDAKLAIAAIASLGKIHPAGIEQSLKPMLADSVVSDVRDSARAAIAEKNVCKR